MGGSSNDRVYVQRMMIPRIQDSDLKYEMKFRDHPRAAEYQVQLTVSRTHTSSCISSTIKLSCYVPSRPSSFAPTAQNWDPTSASPTTIAVLNTHNGKGTELFKLG